MNSHPLRPTRRSLLFTGVLYHNLKKYTNELIVNYKTVAAEKPDRHHAYPAWEVIRSAWVFLRKCGKQ